MQSAILFEGVIEGVITVVLGLALRRPVSLKKKKKKFGVFYLKSIRKFFFLLLGLWPRSWPRISVELCLEEVDILLLTTYASLTSMEWVL